VYLQIQGAYVNHLGEEIQSLETYKGEISERVDRIDVFYGSNANSILVQFVRRLLETYRRLHEGISIQDVKQRGEKLISLW